MAGAWGHAGGRTSATLLPLRRIESSRVILLPSEVISLQRRVRAALGMLGARCVWALAGGRRCAGGRLAGSRGLGSARTIPSRPRAPC
jgi:hypothetical protein